MQSSTMHCAVSNKKFTKQFCLLLYTSSQIDITITIREAPAQISWQILVKYDEIRCLSTGLHSLKKCSISFQQRISKVQKYTKCKICKVQKYAKCKIMQCAKCTEEMPHIISAKNMQSAKICRAQNMQCNTE